MKDFAAPAVQKIGERHAELSAEQLTIGRAAYFDETGIVVASWMPGEPGYDEAVAKFITEPNALQKDWLQYAAGGDYELLIDKLTQRAAAAGGITFDADGCVLLQSKLRLCDTRQ